MRFRGMVGTGGIGHGSFFLLDGNETLGREESRAGRYLERRDYCKLHIVSHYAKALLGDDFAVFPIGKVGDDEAGTRLISEMKSAGLEMSFVGRVSGRPTLHSFCFLYPDGSGGNLTTGNSACGLVDPASIRAAERALAGLGSAGIALAVPEVSLSARSTLLALATQHGLFRAASFTRAEMREVRESGMLEMVDLLAVNLEEAAAAAGIATMRAGSPNELVPEAAAALCRDHPRLLLSITAGAAGSWAWDGRALAHEPALPVTAEGTAGAGDAHFAGVLAGLAAGLRLPESLELAALVAAASVTSVHTINMGITAASLFALCGLRPGVSERMTALLDNPNGRS
jgi:sugar/nucleoside kinase (ribokinase family)